MKKIRIKVKKENAEVIVETYIGEILSEVLLENQIFIPNLCKGNGTCGKCKVKVISGELPVTNADRRYLREEELRQGVRLACKAVLKDDTVVEILENTEEEIVIEAISIKEIEERKLKELHFTEEIEKEEIIGIEETILKTESAKSEEIQLKAEDYFIAIDIGTTTIAMALADTKTGRVCDVYTTINHQRKYGADVISRIEAANSGKGKELKQLIEEDLWKGIEKLTQSKNESGINRECQNDGTVIETQGTRRETKYKNITKVIIAGNTTMLHLLLGYSCETLGKYPFFSDCLSQKECTLKDCINISKNSYYEEIQTIILPGFSAFVGADIVADIIACPGFETEEINLLIDLGTNGEMVIGTKDRLVVTSVAAGPAFEGGNIRCGTASIPGAVSKVKIENQRAVIKTIQNLMPPVGICGSGLISVIAQLKRNKMMDDDGTLKFPYNQSGFSLWKNENGEGITISQKDIREFQMAKAAIRAGIELLIREYGCKASEVEKIYLAGGFGKGVDENDTIGIGILPSEFSGKIQSIGNGVLKGMISFGIYKKNEKQVLSRDIRILSLAQKKEFQEMYIKYVNFVV